ncbi:MAG: OsmC family protein [Chloroflexi bacterium]|nr:OsmC family protein [Chloroflexota bacterium]MYF79766.1 OsmC family protein [Chloroflexota bacterium]MYK61225.1 OsmC family protein [Chloroflexota bacterium]
MTGTFGGALEARGIPAGEGYLESDTIGEIEKEGNVLVIKRINITYKLRVDPQLLEERRDAIDRVMRVHPNSCPVYRSISGSIDVSATLNLV